MFGESPTLVRVDTEEEVGRHLHYTQGNRSAIHPRRGENVRGINKSIRVHLAHAAGSISMILGLERSP